MSEVEKLVVIRENIDCWGKKLIIKCQLIGDYVTELEMKAWETLTHNLNTLR